MSTPEIPQFDSLEQMVSWFEEQPTGKYDLLFGSATACLTTPAPQWKTLAEVRDVRSGAIAMLGLQGWVRRQKPATRG